MKVAYVTQYGAPDTVIIKDVVRPEPRSNEVLVKVAASVVTVADSRIRAARFPKGFGFFARLAFGLTAPRNKVLGSCFSGVVESVGDQVTEFTIGDEVTGMTGMKMGAHAEYLVINHNKAIVHKPTTVSHEDAVALLFGGTAALFFLRDKAKVVTSETVLINGASGAVGTNAVQLAAYFGGNVTAVTSGDNKSLVRSLGASNVIDYTKESVMDTQDRFDVVLDAVGNVDIKNGTKLLNKDGRLVLMVADLGQMVASTRYKQVITGTAAEKKADIAFLLDLLEQKKLKSVIDSVYSLDDIAAAHARADSRSKTGNILVKMI